MLNRLKFRQYLLIGFSIPVSLILGFSVGVYFIGNQISEAFEQVDHAQDLIITTDDMVLSVSMMGRQVRGYLLRKNPEAVAEFENQKRRYNQAVESIKTVAQTSQQAKIFDDILMLGQKFDAAARDAFRLEDQGKHNEAVTNYLRDSKIIVSQLDDLNAKFNEEQKNALAEYTDHAKNSVQLLIKVAILTGILSMVIAATVASLISATMTKTIQQAVNDIANSSSEIAATIVQQERTASQQATSVNQTTTTMDELGNSSQQSALQAEAAAKSAQQVLNLTEMGQQVVGKTLEDMATLKEKVAAITHQILNLNSQTNQIGNISGLVSDLANQTNMLALNAAVEATRAGEYGKGFAVVAAEIRKLADESKKSAGKINALVDDIQGAINATVNATEQGTKTVDRGVKTTQETAETFAHVTQAINTVVTNSQQIYLTAQQQATAIQQVVEAMNVLNQGAMETASGISQTKIGTQKLNEVALNLKAVV